VWPNVYKAGEGGKGIIVRNPFDGFETDQDKKVVPSTFWVNDIFAPSQLYAGSGGGNGNPWCPTHATNCPKDPITKDDGPFNSIQMAYVISKHMDKLFSNWDKAQDSDVRSVGVGVFYPTDANAADLRCAYFPGPNGYECPGGWIDQPTGTWTADASKKGAGWYFGKGCHFNHHNGIDQTNAFDQSSGLNLMKGYECECEYAFDSDWGKWIDQWTQLGTGGKGASWQADLAGCWMNNPRDMINLQNQFYWKRAAWSNQQVPQASYKDNDAVSNRPYWGWNEVAANREVVSNSANWDAVMIKLPAAACPGGNGENDLLSCMPVRYQQQLETQLDAWWSKGYLNNNREIVIVREYMDGSANYFRNFFCQTWTSPSGRYQIKHQGNRCTMQRGKNGGIVV
jgi:hypothetical protein